MSRQAPKPPAEEDERELQSFANAIGIGDNLTLAKHIRFLQRRVTQLEEVVAELREELRKKK